MLFQLEAEGRVHHWPPFSPGEFDHRPALLGSVEAEACPALLRHDGRWSPGDRFVLATDAVAAYLLSEGKTGIEGLLRSDFSDWVAQARQRGMPNDDTTALVVEMPAAR